MEKLVLAYSGGLDTTYCAVHLSRNKNFEVHAVSVNTGGFSQKELETVSKNVYELGVNSYTCIEATQSYYEKVIKYLIFGNVLKNNAYPLSVSAERIIQVIEIVNYAKSIGARYIAHGCTGAGNDQVRFDMIIQILAPNIEIISPIRDMQLSREKIIAYLKSDGIERDWKQAPYSINKGLWGTSVGGKETLSSHLPLPEEAYPSQLQKEGSEKLTLRFHQGELVAVNGKEGDPIENIEAVQQLASCYAIGRDIHVGDTIIGIKGRVGFEAAAPMILIKAHHQLEKHVLSKWQLQHKEYLANWYGMLLHEGQFLDPVMRNIEAFLEDTQKLVCGEVIVSLYPYRFQIDGISSKYDMMQAGFGSYGEMYTHWSPDEAKGFIKFLSNTSKIYHQINQTL